MDRPHLDFALALHRVLPAEGNFAWSPYSVASALGLAAAGARGPTRDELARALAPGGDLDELRRLLARSARPRDAEAAVANTLWMRLGMEFRDAYRQEALGWPGGGLRSADFGGDPEGSRARINGDVEEATRGLIHELLPAGMIHPDIAAVIVNAIYLRVAWRHPFIGEATRPAPFHAPSGTRAVPTMRQQERIGYATAGGWRMATLPTASDDVVVDVLLPAGEAGLTPETLTALHGSSARTKVDLALPRFRLEGKTVLNSPLGRLGIVRAFIPEADFSGITPAARQADLLAPHQRRICIDRVVHQAVLRVDEQGFEGAAATAVTMQTVSFDAGEPVPFHVDRPFLVLVRHAHTGAIYFMARVVEP